MSTLSVTTLQGLSTSPTPTKVEVASGHHLYAPGHIVQSVYAQDQYTYQEVSTTSYVEVSSMNVSITPKSTSSKIKISSQVSWWLTSDANNYMFLTYYRDIGGAGYSNLADDTTYDAMQFYAPVKNATLNNAAHLCYVDSPNTTSAVTYKLYCRKYDGTNHVRLKYAQTASLIMAEEIAQ